MPVVGTGSRKLIHGKKALNQELQMAASMRLLHVISDLMMLCVCAFNQAILVISVVPDLMLCCLVAAPSICCGLFVPLLLFATCLISSIVGD